MIDRDTADRLAREFLPKIYSTAGRMHFKRGCPLEVADLVGSGCVGFAQALVRFDPGRGLCFSTLTWRRIRGEMIDEIRRTMHAAAKKHHPQIRYVGDLDDMVALEIDRRERMTTWPPNCIAGGRAPCPLCPVSHKCRYGVQVLKPAGAAAQMARDCAKGENKHESQGAKPDGA